MTADPTNRDRCEWANVAVAAFAAATRTTAEALDTKVGDLLADLHHLCDAHGVSFPRCLERGDAHYRAEVDDEKSSGEPVTSPDHALLLVAQMYADLFNANPLAEVDRLIADACVDPLWSDRTNLLSLLANEPEELGLVLGSDPEHHAVVRWDGRQWIADSAPVDWDALEERAFAPYDDPAEA